MKAFLLFLTFTLCAGCARTHGPFVQDGIKIVPPVTVAGSDTATTALEIVSATQRIDPRLLEETDQPASKSAEAQAVLYHHASRYAKGYPFFQRSRILAHGGYSARFGTSTNSSGGVRYFFNEQGQIMKTERR